MIRKFDFKMLGIILSAGILLSSCSKDKIKKESNEVLNASKSSIVSVQRNAAGEQIITRRINASPQGFFQDMSSSGNYAYSNDPSYVIGSCNLPGPQYHLYRCRFDHADIPNDKITNVKLNLTIQPSIYSSSNPSYVQVQIPYASCNNSVPWGTPTQAQYAALKSCIENAYLVTTYSVATGALQAFYQRDFNTATSPSLATLLQSPTSFTFGMFSLLSSNAVRIASVTVDVTYTATVNTGTFADMAGMDFEPSTGKAYFWDRSGKVTSSNTRATVEGQVQTYTLPSGKSYTNVVDMAIATTGKAYVWYKDGTMSVGNSISNLGNFVAPKPYALPSGKSPADIAGIGISASNGRCYAFYKNGTYSEGNSTNLGAYAGPQSYSLPPGKTYADILAIGDGSAGSLNFTAWYTDNTVSAGPPTNLGAQIIN